MTREYRAGSQAGNVVSKSLLFFSVILLLCNVFVVIFYVISGDALVVSCRKPISKCRGFIGSCNQNVHR